MRRNFEPALRLPLFLTAGLIGTLGLLTLLRGATIVQSGIASMYDTRQSAFYYGYAALAVVLLALTLLWMVFVRLHRELTELASRDALTRLLNRNGLDDALARHFATRAAPPVTLLQIDVDDFKRINDRFGHAAGDAVLRAVAATLAAHVRGSDFVARVGGEEFVIGCAGNDASVAPTLAERLRNAIDTLELPVGAPGQALRCTSASGCRASSPAWPTGRSPGAKPMRRCTRPSRPGATASRCSSRPSRWRERRARVAPGSEHRRRERSDDRRSCHLSASRCLIRSSTVSPAENACERERAQPQTSPRNLDDALELAPLVVLRQRVAVVRAREAALRRQAQALERDELRGLVDAALQGVLGFELAELGRDQAEHDLLVLVAALLQHAAAARNRRRGRCRTP